MDGASFTTLKQIGKGGQGLVFLVKNKKEEFYALKKIICRSIEELNLSLQEAQNVLKMKNEFIVKCHGFYLEKEKEDYYLSIVYEYCESGTLEDVIKKYRNRNQVIPKDDILQWIYQILIGVMYCHDHNIIHRDLKVIFFLLISSLETFFSSNNVKIGDFGFSKDLQGNRNTDSMLGSPYYLAPEIKNQQIYDYRIDIWGIGAILVDLLLPQTKDFAFVYATTPNKIIEEVEKRYDKEMVNLLKFTLVIEPEKRNSIVEILNLIQNMKCDQSIYKDKIKDENMSKEIIRLKTLVEECKNFLFTIVREEV